MRKRNSGEIPTSDELSKIRCPNKHFLVSGGFPRSFYKQEGKGERKKKESLIEIIAFPSVRFGPSWLSPISRLRTTRCFPILYFFPVWQQKRRDERDRWCGGRSCPPRVTPGHNNSSWKHIESFFYESTYIERAIFGQTGVSQLIFEGRKQEEAKKFAGVTANVFVSAFSREIIGGSKPRNRLIFLPHYSVQFCKGNRLLAALLHFLGSRSPLCTAHTPKPNSLLAVALRKVF